MLAPLAARLTAPPPLPPSPHSTCSPSCSARPSPARSRRGTWWRTRRRRGPSTSARSTPLKRWAPARGGRGQEGRGGASQARAWRPRYTGRTCTFGPARLSQPVIFRLPARSPLTPHPPPLPRQAIWDIKVREGSPEWLAAEVKATRAGLLALRQNVCLLRDEEDPDAFYPR
jgi:hypothetical protein